MQNHPAPPGTCGKSVYPPGAVVQTSSGLLFREDAFVDTFAAEMRRVAPTLPNYMDEITEKTVSAREALEEAVRGVGNCTEKLKPMKKDFLEELRGMRMTSAAEVAAIIKPLEDIRKFFLGPDHQKEVDRLREFVDLCERLESLKKSGFLDTVSDTLIKLS